MAALNPDTPLLDACRVITFVAAAWNLTWAWRGAWELAGGKVWPPSLYQSQVFWTSLGAAAFGMNHFFGNGELWRLCSFLILTLGLVLASAGHRQASGMKARKFYGLFDHMEVALAIATLARVSPQEAEEMATECRRRAARILVDRADD